MPDLLFHIRWPDGRVEKYYSPSTVVKDYFHVGVELSIQELLKRSRQAYARARDRVREKYGFVCTQGGEAEQSIEEMARRYGPDQMIKIVGMQ